MLNYTPLAAFTGKCIRSSQSASKTVDQRSFLEINDLNTHCLKALSERQPAHRNLHSIIWIKNGCGQIFIDFQWYDFAGNTVFFLEPGQLYRFAEQTAINGYIILFSASFFEMSEMMISLTDDNTISRPRFFKTPIYGDTVNENLQDLVQEMIKEASHQSLLGTELLRSLLGIFIVHLARSSKQCPMPTARNSDGQLAKKFMHLLSLRVDSRKMVSDYANELAVSANYLNQVMKRYSGYSASRHIQQYTILEAKRRALYFGTTMKEIAYSLGFDDLAHFSKFFKRNAGTSFRKFKSQIPG